MIAWSLAAVMTAGACDGGSGTAAPDATGEPIPTASPAAVAAEHEVTSPLAALLGFSTTPEEFARQVRATEITRQQLIADCMAEQGFDYVPHVTAGEYVSVDGLPLHLPEDQFRRQYGYGIATGFENALSLKPEEPAPDPNLAIVAEMSETERQAYQRALHGDDPTAEEAGGCQGEASAATDQAAVVVEEFGDELTDLRARVDADRRMVETEQAWAECMAAAGHSYPDDTAIRLAVMRRMNALSELISGEEEGDTGYTIYRDFTLTAEQSDLLAEIKGFELAVANTDQDCRDEVGLDRTRREVRAEYEAEFVDQHRDELRELFPDAGL